MFNIKTLISEKPILNSRFIKIKYKLNIPMMPILKAPIYLEKNSAKDAKNIPASGKIHPPVLVDCLIINMDIAAEKITNPKIKGASLQV